MPVRPVAVLDANVLIPAGLRDLYLSCADAKLFRPVWQAEILEETRRNSERLLIERKHLAPGPAAAAVAHTLGQMAKAFPDALLPDDDWKPLVEAQTCDRKDRHVLAAAVGSGATHLVTSNTRDFPVSSRPPDVLVQTPDRFMRDLFAADPDQVIGAVELMCARLTRPTQTPVELAALLAGGQHVKRFGAELLEALT